MAALRRASPFLSNSLRGRTNDPHERFHVVSIFLPKQQKEADDVLHELNGESAALEHPNTDTQQRCRGLVEVRECCARPGADRVLGGESVHREQLHTLHVGTRQGIIISTLDL